MKGIDFTLKAFGMEAGDLRDNPHARGGIRASGSDLVIVIDPTCLMVEKSVARMDPAGNAVFETRYEPNWDLFSMPYGPERTARLKSTIAQAHGMDPEKYLYGLQHAQSYQRLEKALGATSAQLFMQTDLEVGWFDSITVFAPELSGVFPFVEVAAGNGTAGSLKFTWNHISSYGTAAATLKQHATASDTEPTIAQKDNIIERISKQGSVDNLQLAAANAYGNNLLQLETYVQMKSAAQSFSSKFHTGTKNTTNETFDGLNALVVAGQEIAIETSGTDGDVLDSSTVPSRWNKMYSALKEYANGPMVHTVPPVALEQMDALVAGKLSIQGQEGYNVFMRRVRTINGVPLLVSDGISLVEDPGDGGNDSFRCSTISTAPEGLAIVTQRGAPLLQTTISDADVNGKPAKVVRTDLIASLRLGSDQAAAQLIHCKAA